MKKTILIALLSVAAAALTAFIVVKTNVSEAPVVTTTADSSMYRTVNLAQTDYPDFTYAAEASVDAVVYVKVTVRDVLRSAPSSIFDFFFGYEGKPQSRESVGSGSGVIIRPDGYIVTNNHVIENASKIEVTLNNNKTYEARLVGTDPATDVALIKIDAQGLPVIPFEDSDKLRLGEWVLAIGNPFSLTSTVTAGIVSAKARSLGATPGSIESFIQTDAAINPGNSGGALVNARGELVGINAMLYSQTGSYSGYGFAIPTSIMNKVVEDLRKYGTVQRALLGISGSDVSTYIDAEKEKGKEVDLGTVNGIYIVEVSADGAAYDAGLKAGDVITQVDGKKIEKFGELQEMLVSHRPGDKITVTYIRDKKVHTATLTLRNIQGTTVAVQTLDTESLGAALRPLNDKEKRELNLPYGLLISAIRDGKLKEAGLTKGMILMKINDREMRSLQDFDEVVKAANLSSDRVLWVRAKSQSGINRSFAVELADSKDSSNRK